MRPGAADALGARRPVVAERPVPGAGGAPSSAGRMGAYGPATRDDFTLWWHGTTRTQAQRLFESLDVTPVELAGTRAYLLAADAPPPPLARSVRLLPAFDPYVVGAPRSGGLFPAAHKARVFRPQGWISAVLLVDGHVEGVWRHERKNGRLDVAKC